MSEKRLTLIFSGNDFKYELEGVCKLFFPVESFNFFFWTPAGVRSRRMAPTAAL